MSLKPDLIMQLDLLIAEGKRLDKSYSITNSGKNESEFAESDFRAFLTDARNTISNIAGNTSDFYTQIPELKAKEHLSQTGYAAATHVPAAIGSLMALKRAINADLLQPLESKLRANVHDDFLSQADDLLSFGYHVAAMVLIGGVLEDHLRKLCDTRKLTIKGKPGLSAYNDALHGLVYEKTVWRRIQSIGDVRNQAAHGEGEKVNRDDVDDGMKFVRKLLSEHPF